MITQARLHELLSYDPETGVFTWRKRTGQRSAGSTAGCKDDRGYIVINVDSRRYYAHRLAWLFVYGQFPHNATDHVNGKKSDNRIANLRDVTLQINAQNRRSAMASNKSAGLLGVRKLKGKYLAQITAGGKEVHLGTFDNADDAHACYVDAKRKLHEGCTL